MEQKAGHSALLLQCFQNLIQFLLVIYFLYLHSFPTLHSLISGFLSSSFADMPAILF